jgi:hypothetical protein
MSSRVRKAKPGPPITRRGGKRMEVYVRPAEVVKRIEERCRDGKGRQEVLLGLILLGLAAEHLSNTILPEGNGCES